MEEVRNQNQRPQVNPEALEDSTTSFWRRLPVILVGTFLAAVLLFFVLSYLVESFTHESTDDAFLDADIVALSPKVAGRVHKVPVQDNQTVRAGELLVEIDPADLEVQLAQKRAAVAVAESNTELLKASLAYFNTQIETAQATAKQSAAEAAASKATAERAGADLKRAEDLIRNKTISPQEYDTASAAAIASQANLKAAEEKVASDRSKIAQAQSQFEAGRKAFERGEAQTRQAEWDTKAAELNLSYARVAAPVGGRVTRKAVQSGDYVQVGQKLMAIVPQELFVTANFKETQLRHIRTNQGVRVVIDSVGGSAFKGHVDSIQAGSGARFSLLPPENAVGNYVKVVQRVPVKIVFDEPVHPSHVLGPGMSVVPSVRVSSFTVSEALLIVVATVLGLLFGALWWSVARRRKA